jgi:hypothetical protein
MISGKNVRNMWKNIEAEQERWISVDNFLSRGQRLAKTALPN